MSPATIAPGVDQITQALSSYRYLGVDEYAIQDGIAAALSAAGIVFEREKRLGPHERLDFAVATIAIEVKIRGSRADLIRQLARYARHEDVEQIILASTSRVLLAGAPELIHQIPVTGVLLRGRAL